MRLAAKGSARKENVYDPGNVKKEKIINVSKSLCPYTLKRNNLRSLYLPVQMINT